MSLGSGPLKVRTLLTGYTGEQLGGYFLLTDFERATLRIATRSAGILACCDSHFRVFTKI